RRLSSSCTARGTEAGPGDVSPIGWVLEKVLVVYHRISIDNADRVAIRLRILTCSRGDIDRSAGSIVDNEGLPETFVQFLAQHAHEDVFDAAGARRGEHVARIVVAEGRRCN